MEQPRVIILPPIITSVLIDPANNIINRSFNEQETRKKPLCKKFQETLNIHIIEEKDIEQKLSCSICQDEFKLNEETIVLPCKDNHHFFHKNNTEECNGIFPWFEEHNTCPMCRFEFPSEPEPEAEPEPEHEAEPEPEPGQQIFEQSFVLTPEQISQLGGNIASINIDEIDNMLRNEIDNIFNGNNEEQENNTEEIIAIKIFQN